LIVVQVAIIASRVIGVLLIFVLAALFGMVKSEITEAFQSCIFNWFV